MANAAARRGTLKHRLGQREPAELFGADDFDRLVPPPSNAVLVRGRYRMQSGKRKSENTYMSGRRIGDPSVSPRMQSPVREGDEGEASDALDNTGLLAEYIEDDNDDWVQDDNVLVYGDPDQAATPGHNKIKSSKGKQKATVEELVSEDAPATSSPSTSKRRSRTQVSQMQEFREVLDLYTLESVRKEHIKSYASSPHCIGCIDKTATQPKATEKEPRSGRATSKKAKDREINEAGGKDDGLAKGKYRCRDCFGCDIWCKECVVGQHRRTPFHNIERWNGNFFEKASLLDAGLRLSLGHGGQRCPQIVRRETPFVVLHSNGIHQVNIDECGCLSENEAEESGKLKDPRWHYMRLGIWPTTQENPSTGVTLSVLQLFHATTLQSQVSAYDFHEILVRMTQNEVRDNVPQRYKGFMRAARQFRHIAMLKRGGALHLADGPSTAKEGSCAVKCPACPQPGMNIPLNWRDTCPDNELFAYRVTVAVDGNFKLKLRSKKGDTDVPLGDGLAYMINTELYKLWQNKVPEVNERERCRSMLNAIEKANLDASKGFRTNGVIGVACGRHGMNLPCGFCDMPKGESYKYSDLALGSALRYLGEHIWELTISYDLACQWHIHWPERQKHHPLTLQIDFGKMTVTYIIPDFHRLGHGDECQVIFAFDYLPGAGRTCGEIIETGWARYNSLAASTREMGVGQRGDTLDDHWGDWNFQKCVRIGKQLLQKLHEAMDGNELHGNELTALEEVFDAMKLAKAKEKFDEWAKWRMTGEKPYPATNPFETSGKAMTLAELQYELSRDDAVQFSDKSFSGEMTLTGLLRQGMEYEDQLHAIKADMDEDRIPRTALKAAEMQTRINSYAARVKRWKAVQAVLMPLVSVHIPSEFDTEEIPMSSVVSKIDNTPLKIALHMPSEVPRNLRSKVCTEEMIETEAKLRYAIGLASIVDLRNALKQRYGVGLWKTFQAGHGVATTRARGTIKASSKKCRRLAAKYRRCRSAMLELDEPNAPLSRFDSIPQQWQTIFKELKPSDVRFMNVLVRDMEGRRQVAKQRREKIAQINSVTRRSGQKHRTVSWIWRMGKESADLQVRAMNRHLSRQQESEDAPAYDVDDPTVQAEWAKARARADRWREELILVQIEMKRVVSFFEWKAEDWETKKYTRKLRHIEDVGNREAYYYGLAGYAARQAQIYRNMARHCVTMWRNHLKYYQLDHKWMSGYIVDVKEAAMYKKVIKAQERRMEAKHKRQKEEDEMEDVDDNPDNIWEDMEDIPMEGQRDNVLQ